MEELIRKETLTLQEFTLKHTHTHKQSNTHTTFRFLFKSKKSQSFICNKQRYTSEIVKGMFCVLKAGDMEEDAIFFKNRLDELNHKYINLEETVVLSLSA